jgi:mRNA interferase RelE/StbE
MGVNFSIQYHETAVKEDIPCLSSEWKRKIRQAIEEKLSNHPEIFGKPLRRSLKGFRKLRIGDYRVIFRIEKKTVKILIIQHRSTVYKKMNKRIKSAII